MFIRKRFVWLSQDDIHYYGGSFYIKKIQSKVVNYRDYKYFEYDRFRTDLFSEFDKANIEEEQKKTG